jgi:serine/threonine protein kinase
MGLTGNDSSPALYAFKECFKVTSEPLINESSPLAVEDQLAMMVLQSDSSVCDKIIHGIVAYMSTLGFEIISGRIRGIGDGVSFRENCFRYDDEVGALSSQRQIFVAFFKRPTPKTNLINHVPISELFGAVQARLNLIAIARSADSQTSLCSEDLAGIKELVLLPDVTDASMNHANDWPLVRRPVNRHRLLSQPVQGSGHRPVGQSILPRRYKLTVVGVNQAGFLTFVHNMLMIAGFRIIRADIDTMRGSYAFNTYEIETFSKAGERILRANFQCVVPIRSSVVSSTPYPLVQSPSHLGNISGKVGIWFDDGMSAYYGSLLDGNRNGFGRFWRSQDKQCLANYTFEGEWRHDNECGVGWRSVDDGRSVSYAFGIFSDGELVDGSILYPFEPPSKSVRIDPSHRPDQCLYKSLIKRSEHWRRQLPRSERPISYLPAAKLRSEYGANLRSLWTVYAESPVAVTASMDVCQVAAIFEMCALKQAARAAFARRIDGGLLEAMSEHHLSQILGISNESERNMFVQFLSIMTKAHIIDRHMRQPASVVDALMNPSVSGRFLSLDKMRVVDSLGEGAYGKVIYAEYQSHEDLRSLERSFSGQLLQQIENTSFRSPSSQPSLISAFTRKSRGVLNSHFYVALKEQVGSRAQLENSCELVREWATLNALPHENIVQLEGICADPNAPMFIKRYLATALIEATLPSLVYSTDAYGPAPPLTPLLTIQLAGDIANGLAHMHSLDILHGDIKSPNVLVDPRTKNRPVARLCDFGHAAVRIGPRPQRRMCTFGWASPESLRDAETDKSSDVWSWGVVCWEMYVREVPWKGCSHPQMLAAVGYGGLDPSGFRNTRIPERVKAERKVAQLCKKCWSIDPTIRPTMNRVLHIVNKLSRISAQEAVMELQSLLSNS